MAAKAESTNQAHQGSQPRTLGDVLYPDSAKTYVSEATWVRLVQSIAEGDQQSLRLLFQEMHRIVFTLVLRITSNPETAEEVTLDVFHDVWRKASTYDPVGGSVAGWIMNQARCRAIDRLRFDHRKKRTIADADGSTTTTQLADPEQTSLFEEQKRLLWNALSMLKPEERQAIETAFFAEITYEEAAAKLNQPVGTVKSRIRSGLSKLRVALASESKNR